MQDLGGGAPRPITPEGFIGRIVSPDGKYVVGKSQEKGCFLFPIDGGEPQALAGLPLDSLSVRFDAAGTGIFMASLGVPMKIVRYDIASGRTEPWKEIAVSDPAGVMQFNRVVLTPDGKSYVNTFWRAISRLYVVRGLK